MIRILPFLMVLAVASTALAGQTADGDLMPRSGTLSYMVSDSPDVLYRLFGKDNKDGWRLRSIAHTLFLKDVDKEDIELKGNVEKIHEYIFGNYEQVSKVELGLIDVTMDGPKYLLVLHTNDGAEIDPAPEFLKQFEEGSETYRDVTYIKYKASVPEGEKTLGMDRFYVAKTSFGLVVSNFESTIRNAIDKISDKSTEESLSTRSEFKEWVASRGKHDLSVFVVGREIQSLIERLMPSEEQAGADIEGVYKDIDSWVALREYSYIVFNGDYDESTRGITVSSEFKTRRATPLLEKLSIEPKEFEMLKYVPSGAVIRAGAQLGDAKKNFDSLIEIAEDLSDSISKLAMGRSEEEPYAPKKEQDDGKEAAPDEKKPSTEDDWLPKNFVLPIDDLLRGPPSIDDENEDGSSEVEKVLEQLEKMLGKYGTSRDQLLGVFGSEIIVFVTMDRARALNGQGAGFQNTIMSGNIGLILNIKDTDKLKSILAIAKEKDSEGVFQGFSEVGFMGFMLQVSEEHAYGYCITKDALLISVPMGVQEENQAPSVISGLSAMATASTRTTTGNDSFLSNCSKFVEVDLGAIFRLSSEVKEMASLRLDRNAKPEFGGDSFSEMTDMVITYRQKEATDGIEVALRVSGLPDFGKLIEHELLGSSDDGEAGGVDVQENSYSYTESNLNISMEAFSKWIQESKGKLDLDTLIAEGKLRAGALQTPFDSRWIGDKSDLRWTTLRQIKRDNEGNLDEWVDEAAVKMIEENEKAEWRSFKLNEGDIEGWIRDYKAGFIVMYQEKADSADGHFVLYANGTTGWLHRGVLKDALELNKNGEPIPAKDAWDEGPKSEKDKDWKSKDSKKMPNKK